MVLRALIEPEYLDKNMEFIERVLDDYKIVDIYDLSKKVLNKKKNPVYNNFIEKITCREQNKVNYILCDNKNYKNIYAFCELIIVFVLDIDKIIELINEEQIMSVCELSSKKYILEKIDNNTSYGFELLGLQYYLNEKSFTRKYYDILRLLELDKELKIKDDEKHLTLREHLYNYHNPNTKVVKDLNSIMVLFDFYNIFDSYVLNMDDDDYNWDLGILKGVDLQMPCWDNVNFFVEYDVRERIIRTINRLTSVDDEFLNRGDNPTNPYAEDGLNPYSQQNKLQSNQDIYEEEDDIFQNDLKTFRKRYKTMYDKKDTENKKTQDILNNKLSLKFIKENFSSKFVEIIDEIVLLSTRKCDLECENSSNPLFSKCMFYVIEIFKILTSKERMLFVGILLIIVSILLNFIIASK